MTSPLTVPLLLFLACTGLSTLTSVDRRASFEALLSTAALVAISLVVHDLLARRWSTGVLIDGIILLASLLLVEGLGEIAAWYWRWLRLSVPTYPTFPIALRLFGVSDHPNQLPLFVYLALPFVILRLYSAQRRWHRGLWFAWLAAADIVLYYANSRGGFIATAVAAAGTLLLLALQRQDPRECGWARWVRSTGDIWLATMPYLILLVCLWRLNAALVVSDYTTHGGGLATGAGRFTFWRNAWEQFAASPLLGGGPQTYSLADALGRPQSRTPSFMIAHAHNLYLNILAQQGIIGAAAAAWVLLSAARPVVRLMADTSGRPEPLRNARVATTMAAAAGLAGWLVHSLVDVVTRHPYAALVVLLVACVMLAEAGAMRRSKVRATRRSLALLTVPLLVLVVQGQHGRAAEAYFAGVVAALDGRWEEAARSVHEAAQRDPLCRHYARQAAYAQARATGEDTASRTASAGPRLPSYGDLGAGKMIWAADYLNAAAYWQAQGEADRAEEALRQAALHWRDWPIARLLLATTMADGGDVAGAASMAREALALRPEAGRSLACQQSRMCRETSDDVWADTPADAGLLSRRAIALVDAGNLEGASELLATIPLNLRTALPWLARAHLHTAEGRLDHATYALEVSRTLGAAASPATRARLALTEAEALQLHGSTEQVVEALESAVTPPVSELPYEWLPFLRFALPGPLVPSLADLERTADDVEVYARLARLYALQGRDDDAAWARARADTLATLFGAPTLP